MIFNYRPCSIEKLLPVGTIVTPQELDSDGSDSEIEFYDLPGMGIPGSLGDGQAKLAARFIRSEDGKYKKVR